MTTSGAPPGWYPDPQQPGQQRYFDGTAWTEHCAPLSMPPYVANPWWIQPPWKGAKLGRPQYGPDALADPARRLGARLLDGLIFLPVFAGFIALAVALVAPHAGPIFPRVPANPNKPGPTPGSSGSTLRASEPPSSQESSLSSTTPWRRPATEGPSGKPGYESDPSALMESHSAGGGPGAGREPIG